MSDRGREYFQQLQTAIDEERNTDVIDIATQILNFMPDDHEAKLCRAVAYLMEGDYEEAYQDLHKLKGCEFEKAYCLYKLERFSEALTIVNGVSKSMKEEERFIHLTGQILFRLDRGEECLKEYSKLPEDSIGDDERIAISAACAIAHDSEKALKLLGDDADVEQIYNTTIACLEDGQIEKAIELCELGYSKVEKKDSLQGYLFTILRVVIPSIENSEEFNHSKVLLEIAENAEANQYVRSIAALNYTAVAENDRANQKKLRHLFSDFDNLETIRTPELEAIMVNNFVIAHALGETKKAVGLAERASKLDRIDPLIAESFKRTTDASAPAGKFAAIFDAQKLIEQKKFVEAADILLKTPYQKEPRGISVISELYARGGNVPRAIEFLKQHRSETVEFLEFAARFALRHGDAREAKAWGEALTKAAGNAPWSVALLAQIYAPTDVEMAERYAQRLKPETISDEAADSLEAKVLVAAKKSTAAVEAEVLSQVEIETREKEEKRKQKLKRIEAMTPEQLAKYKAKKRARRRLQLPRNYDPQRVVDPERWIRKNQRQGAKGRRRPKQPQAKSIGKGGKTIDQPKAAPQLPPKRKGGKKKSSKSKW